MRSYLYLFFVVLFTGCAFAQLGINGVASLSGDNSPFANFSTTPLPSYVLGGDPNRHMPELAAPVSLPRMAPQLALDIYQGRMAEQGSALLSYSATTVVRAELPDTAQQGEFELQRYYSAPRTLTFKPVRFSGDNFVKTNIIARVLQSEVDHLQKDDLALTALTPANYKFSYKGTSELDNRTVHVYQVKPRKKRAGLFKGHIFLDARTGSLVRAEGTVVKSPSLFIKKIDFVQDYADVGSFTFPVHIHSEARTRLVGRAIVDIYQRQYEPVLRTSLAKTTGTSVLVGLRIRQLQPLDQE
jgi:hypothetical protein